MTTHLWNDVSGFFNNPTSPVSPWLTFLLLFTTKNFYVQVFFVLYILLYICQTYDFESGQVLTLWHTSPRFYDSPECFAGAWLISVLKDCFQVYLFTKWLQNDGQHYNGCKLSRKHRIIHRLARDLPTCGQKRKEVIKSWVWQASGSMCRTVTLPILASEAPFSHVYDCSSVSEWRKPKGLCTEPNKHQVADNMAELKR